MVALKDPKYRDLKREVEKEISHLKSLYSKIDRFEKRHKGTANESEASRVRRIEAELKKKFPEMEFDRELLKLVGILHYRNPPSNDKELIAKAIAEHYE
jgi:predicted  nucleic acid-binding Zn-ribbon protein